MHYLLNKKNTKIDSSSKDRIDPIAHVKGMAIKIPKKVVIWCKQNQNK